MPEQEPLIRFYRLIDGARPPERADRSAAGTLPTRAYRYCEAVTAATAFGWWIFPPADLLLQWDGADIFWQYDGAPDWLPLLPAAQFPGFAARFDAVAPRGLRQCAPPLLTALPEPGGLQIWTGLMARTAPGWSLLLRAPANLPLPGGFVLYEGIVETDRWFGPLFTNLRFTRSHTPIRLSADFPLLLAQPVPQSVYGDATLGALALVDGMAAMSAADWADYETTIVTPNRDPDRRFGAYAVAARRRAARPAAPARGTRTRPDDVTPVRRCPLHGQQAGAAARPPGAEQEVHDATDARQIP